MFVVPPPCPSKVETRINMDRERSNKEIQLGKDRSYSRQISLPSPPTDGMVKTRMVAMKRSGSLSYDPSGMEDIREDSDSDPEDPAPGIR